MNRNQTINPDYILGRLQQVSLTVAQIIEQIENATKQKPNKRRETIAEIITRVGEEFNISPEAIASKSRAFEISAARKFVNYIAFKAGHRLAAIDRTMNRPNGCARKSVASIEDLISIQDKPTLAALKAIAPELMEGK